MIELGFNIDAFGFTFGGSQTGMFTRHGTEVSAAASPNSVSALLVGPRDIGMLKAEFLFGYKINENWRVRVGLTNLVTEYHTETDLQPGNVRFRALASMPIVGVTYTLGN